MDFDNRQNAFPFVVTRGMSVVPHGRCLLKTFDARLNRSEPEYDDSCVEIYPRTPLIALVCSATTLASILYFSILLHCIVQSVSLSFTTGVGIRGHLQVCKIFHFHMLEGFCFAASFSAFFLTWSHSECFHLWGGLNMTQICKKHTYNSM
jgi:hypothetical protein